MASKLDWSDIEHAPISQQFRALTKELLTLRQQKIVPLIKDGFVAAKAELLGGSKQTGGVDVRWQTVKGDELQIIANFSAKDLQVPTVAIGELIWASMPVEEKSLRPDQIIVRCRYSPATGL